MTWPIGMGARLSRRLPPAAERLHHLSSRGEVTRQRRATIVPGPRRSAARRARSATRRSRELARRHRAACAARRIRSTTTRSSPAGRRRCSSARAINNFGVEPLLDVFVELRAAAAAARRRRARRRAGRDERSPASCSRSRRTWIRSTATASRSCASARARSRRHEGAARAHRQGDEARQRADVHGVAIASTSMSAYRRRHHRPAQPRHDLDRRQLHARARRSRSPASRTSRRSCSGARVLRDPLKLKQLQKGLAQLCEEGATQVFRAAARQRSDPGRGRCRCSSRSSRYRLSDEYGVDCAFETVGIVAARWVRWRRCGAARRIPREARDERREGSFRRARVLGAEHVSLHADRRTLAEDSVFRDARARDRGVSVGSRSNARAPRPLRASGPELRDPRLELRERRAIRRPAHSARADRRR